MLAKKQEEETVINEKYRILCSMAIAILAATASVAEVRDRLRSDSRIQSLQDLLMGKGSRTDPLCADRIKAAVDSALAAKGWAETLGRRVRRWLWDINDK
jgi:hypothetical protein